MNIEHIQNFRTYEANAKLSQRKDSLKPSARRRVEDTYQGAASDVEIDKTKIDSIRKRIQSGFYNSNEVNEDLTESFAKIFKQLL